jgi:bacterioferritin
MAEATVSEGILASENDEKREQIIELLERAYWMEIETVMRVIEAEKGAIEHYTRIVDQTDQVDPVTNDMVIAILHDEQGHRRLFEGFLREYEAEGLA